MKNKRLGIILGLIVCLLLIPLVAMQFTDQVNWDITDFIVMGGLLLATGLCIELIIRKVSSIDKRAYIILGILIVFLLIWAELAVGVFGTPFAGS
jgi:hypothetical protein